MRDSTRSWIVTGAVAAGLGVMLGAFGAHGLKTRVTSEMLAVFETGVRYQMYHAFGLIVVGALAASRPRAALRVAGWAFVLGIVIFSGSLYVMTFTGMRWLGAITPLGGVSFIVGWFALALGVRGAD